MVTCLDFVYGKILLKMLILSTCVVDVTVSNMIDSSKLKLEDLLTEYDSRHQGDTQLYGRNCDHHRVKVH